MGTVVIQKTPSWKRQDMFYIFFKSIFNTPLLKLIVFPMKNSWDTIKFYGWCFSCLFIVLPAFLLHTVVHAFFLLSLPLHSICFLFLSLDFLFFWKISLDDPSKKENADCPRLGHCTQITTNTQKNVCLKIWTSNYFFLLSYSGMKSSGIRLSCGNDKR